MLSQMRPVECALGRNDDGPREWDAIVRKQRRAGAGTAALASRTPTPAIAPLPLSVRLLGYSIMRKLQQPHTQGEILTKSPKRKEGPSQEGPSFR